MSRQKTQQKQIVFRYTKGDVCACAHAQCRVTDNWVFVYVLLWRFVVVVGILFDSRHHFNARSIEYCAIFTCKIGNGQ